MNPLKQWRRCKGLSAEKAARLLHISISHYNHVEQGARNAGSELMRKLSRAGVDVQALAEWYAGVKAARGGAK